MRARELMTTKVASVPPEATAKEIARLLLSRGISAVPVVDRAGSPIGMVSEGVSSAAPSPSASSGATGGSPCWRRVNS
jgi:predicted transcriptional regulator